MRAPAKPKPRASDEVARVLRIAQMLDEEIRSIAGPPPDIIRTADIFPAWNILEVAERIAARTEG